MPRAGPIRFDLPLAAAAGALTWIGICIADDRREAFDSPLYLTVGLPLLAVLCFVLGRARPGRTWRIAFACGGGQALVAFVANPGANLLPLGLIAFALLSLPLAAAAALGGRLSPHGN